MIKARRMVLAGAYGAKRNSYRILIGKPEGQIPLRSHARWWENNVKMGVREIVRSSTEWIYRAQERDRWGALLSLVMNLRIP
jgi:hypothetical protein